MALFVGWLVCSSWINHVRVESKQRTIWSWFSLLGQIRKKLNFNQNYSHYALAMCCRRAQHGTPASTWQLCLFPAQISVRGTELQQQGQEGAAGGIPRCPCGCCKAPQGANRARCRENKTELYLRAGPGDPPGGTAGWVTRGSQPTDTAPEVGCPCLGLCCSSGRSRGHFASIRDRGKNNPFAPTCIS